MGYKKKKIVFPSLHFLWNIYKLGVLVIFIEGGGTKLKRGESNNMGEYRHPKLLLHTLLDRFGANHISKCMAKILIVINSNIFLNKGWKLLKQNLKKRKN